MYFKRKIDIQLDNWLKKDTNSPALVIGIRQCGKTETIREFAKRNNLIIIEMNFWTHPEYCLDFAESLDVETLISNISLRFPTIDFDPKKILLFFDEIQDCPRARLSFKNFKNNGKYKIIGSGSYLGINGYIKGETTPTPVGYEKVFQMKTMDFEEFLWALGYDDKQINHLIQFFDKRCPVPNNLHQLYKDLFLNYACMGGFPRVIQAYLKNYKIIDAYDVLNDIVFDMKSDFGRRIDKNGIPVFNKSEISRIHNVFDLIPTFLAKENKRFVVSKVSHGSQYEKNDAIEYLKQAHIVSKVHNVEIPSLPLNGEKVESQFKLFPEDIGIIMSVYGIDTIAAINRGELGQGKGAIYESIVFDSLNKAGIDTFYYMKESGLEIDFVISYKGYATLLEVKARNGNAKSCKTIMNHPEHYGKTKLIKIGDYNIGEEGDILTIPHYLTFALGRNDYNF